MAAVRHEKYAVLQDMLHDIFSLDIHHIQDLDKDISLIDNGLRAALDKRPQYQDILRILRQDISPHTAIHFQDQYYLHYILVPGTVDLIRYHIIGPFHISSLTDDDLFQIQKTNGLSDQQTSFFKNFHQQSAEITIQQALSIAKNILLTASDSVDFKVQPVIYNQNPEKGSAASFSEKADFPLPTIDAILLHEQNMFSSAVNGDYQSALEENMFLISAFTPVSHYNNSYYRTILSWINAMFRKEGIDAGMPILPLTTIHIDMQRAIDECKSYYDHLKLRITLLATYFEFYQEHSVKQYSPVIRKAVNYICSNLQQDLDLNTLAQELGFSATYVLHKFKKEVGLSPMQYINQKRMQRAKRLLLSSQSAVQEISRQVGISDPNYFAKQFKKAYGQTPREFRKNHQA